MSALALSLKLSAIKTLSAVQRAINILKSAGPGAWYDPSDLTTLFQDSAGTTPVTAVEQPVGLILDKSQGLVPGAELVTNGDFSAGTAGWNAKSATISTVGGELSVLAASTAQPSASQAISTVSGKTYKISARLRADAANTVAKSARIRVAENPSGGPIYSGPYEVTSNGVARELTAFFTAPIATVYVLLEVGSSSAYGNVGDKAYFDNISVRELPGNHLIQPTATSRPTLSSRYNMLTKTEAFDDAVWPKTNMAIAPNATTAPDGTLTADTATASSHPSTSISLQRGMSANAHTFSVFAKASSVSVFRLDLVTAAYATGAACQFNLSAGTAGAVTNFGATVGSTASIVSVGYGWYRCSITVTTTATNHFIQLYPDANGSVHIWGASLTTTADASLPYQRVNTATDYDFDFSKFPPFLRFDGVDDSMYTAASIDFTSTDKLCVFAGVHKVGITSGAVLETSATSDTNNGSFSYFTGAWSDARDYFSTRGTVLSHPSLSVTPPVTYVIAAASNISGDLITVRSNSVQVVNSSADLGTGNFGNYPLYVGRRNNASLPFSGRIYQLAIKGKAMTAAEISTLESYINSKTKAF